MPVGKYYKGSGGKVMKEMVRRYGEKRGKAVFYAVANKKGMAPKRKAKKRAR